MRGMLTKDIRLMLQQKKFFIFLIFIAIFINYGSDDYFIIGYLTFACSIFVLSTMSYDEYDNCYPFLMTLPVDRKSYVKEKYLFGLLLGAVAWILGVVISLGSHIIRTQDLAYTEFFLMAIIYIPIFMILLSITIPFQLKFGGEKSRIVMLGTVGAVFLVVHFLIKLAENMGVDIDAIGNALSAVHIGVINVALILVAVVGLMISYIISSAIMEKKDF